MTGRDTMGLQRQEPGRASEKDREDLLREQWSESFASRLLRIVRRAIGDEIQGHRAAGSGHIGA